MTNHLVKTLNEENILSDTQAGFRQDNRTSDQIFILKTLIENYKTIQLLLTFQRPLTMYGIKDCSISF